MASLAEVRAAHPEYNDLDDQQLADGLHAKFYADMPKDQFYAKVGLRGTASQAAPEVRTNSTPLGVARATASGARQGFVGLPGMPKDVANLIGSTQERFGQTPGLDPIAANVIPFGLGHAFNAARQWPVDSEQMNAGYEKVTGAKPYQPQGPTEEVALTLGKYAPAAIGGAGPLSMAARVGTTALGGETGKLAGSVLSGGDPLAEQWGQVAGSSFGLGGAAPLERMVKPTRTVQGPIPNSAYLEPQPGSLSSARANAPAPIKEKPAPSFGRLETIMKRGGVRSSADLQARAAPYQDAGVTPVMGQLAGEPGLLETKALVSAPGKTAQRAKTHLDEVKPQVQPAALAAVDKSFGKRSEFELETGANAAFGQYKVDYNRVLDQARPAPASLGGLDLMWQTRVGPKLANSAKAAIAERLPPEGLTEAAAPPGRIWQIRKEALDDAIAAAEVNAPSQVPSLMNLKRDLLAALDETFPGYGEVRGKWAELEGNLRAMQTGKSWLDNGKTAPTDQSINNSLLRMTKTQRFYAKVGMRSELRRLIESQPADHATLSRILESGSQVNKIRAVLGKAEGDAIIGRLKTLRDHAGEMNYFTPRAGSQNAPLFAQYADMLHQGAELGGSGSLVSAGLNAARIAGDPGKYLQNFEGMRNVQGRRMLEPATPEAMALFGRRLDELQANRAVVRRRQLQGGTMGSNQDQR